MLKQIKNKILDVLFFKERELRYPETYWEELHYQSYKIVFPACIIFLVAWLPYISVDTQLVPTQPFIIYLRYGLTGFGIIGLCLHYYIFKKKAMYTLIVLASYIEVGVAIITGLSGASPNYMGGYFFCLMLLLMCPISIFSSLTIVASSIIAFFLTLLFIGVDISQFSLAYQYSLQDLLAVTVVLSLFLQILNRTRYRSWEKSKQIEKQGDELKEDKEKIDHLLLNILPSEIAQELKDTGQVKPVHYKMTTIVFTDFVDFTKISEQLSPEELIFELDNFFSAFDRVIGEHKLEKLKTIGDSYMFAGGVPIETNTNALDSALASLKIRNYVAARNKEKVANKKQWEIRIGMNSGPIMAGIVGTRKFVYDIWGDTVNVASRMESSGTPGEINISESTYNLLKDFFQTEYRGKLNAKNKGELNMYYLKRIKPQLSDDPEGMVPNSLFWENYNKIKIASQSVS